MTTQFETGKTYYARSICDHETVFEFEILRRTAKSVWINVHGATVRRAIEVYKDIEAFYPHGKYSMAAVVKADKITVKEEDVQEIPAPEDDGETGQADLVREQRRAVVEEKREAKLDRFTELAEKNRQASHQAYEQSHQLASVIPMGQPILVGHYSEKADRRYRDRVWNTMGKSVDLQGKADYYQKRADVLENDTTIRADDPDAIQKLRAKIQDLQDNQEQMKKANAAIRKLAKVELSDEDRAAKVAELSGIDIAIAREGLSPKFGKPGFAGFQLSNNSAEIRRCQARLAELEAQWEQINRVGEEQTFEHPELGLEVVYNYVDNRVQLLFEDKPRDEVRDRLKGRGFKWSPRAGAWQRHLNANGKAAAAYIVQWLSEQ